MPIKKKLILVGDKCGKTCLLEAYLGGIFKCDYSPTTCDNDNRVGNVDVNGETIELSLWDSSGLLEVYDQARSLMYPETDVVLICFSVVSEVSLANARSGWRPEVKHHCPNVPVLLIGTKSDLRDDKGKLERMRKKRKKPVSRKKAEAVAKSVGAVRYIECSAKTKFNVDEVFVEAARATLAEKGAEQETKNTCVLM